MPHNPTDDTRLRLRRLSAMRVQRLVRAAGWPVSGRPREALAEELESRTMLAGFDPAGAGIGDLNVASARNLTPADITFVDINGSNTGQYDRVRISANVGLNGVLKLRFGAGAASMAAGSTLEIVNRNGGTGALSGTFVAIDGLNGPAGWALDLVAIQSPTRLVLVATTLPSADLTIAVDDDADVAGLVSLFAGGSGNGLDDSAAAEGTIHAFGQRIEGLLNFEEADDAGEAFLNVELEPRGPNVADKARVVVTSSGVDAMSVYGTASFTLRRRGSTGGSGGGLRIDGDFNAEAYAFLDSDVPVTAGFDANLGPISLEDVMPSVGAIVVDGQSASLDVSVSGSKASLMFVSGQAENPGGVTAEAEDPAGSFTIATSYNPATMSVTRAQGSGAFSLSAAMFTLEVPDFVMGSATNIELKYDPNGGDDQEILRLQALSLEIPKLKAKFDVGNPDADDDIPGLIVYKNGFEFTDATFTLNTSTFGANTMPDAQGFLRIGSGIKVRDPSVGLSGFVLRYDSNGDVSQFDLSSITIGAAEIILGTDASLIRANGTGLAATILLADNGAPNGFIFSADNLTLHLGSLLEVSADDVVINPQPDTSDADPDNDNYLEIGSLTVTLDLGGLFGGSNPNPPAVPFSATIRNFAIDANGHFVPGVAPDRFSIGMSLSLGDMEEFLSQSGGPAETPAGADPMGGGGGFSASVDVFWDDITAAPDRFVMVASFSIFGTVGPLTLSGSVSDLVFDSERIFNGDFPIVSVRQITASVSGDMFGAEFNGTLIAGAITLDAAGNRLGIDEVLDDPTRVDRTALYFGAKGGFEIAGRAGFELLFGFSTEGFIQAYVRAGVPILLEPISGLTITDFRGGITLNGPELPALTDPVQLRSSIFKPTLNLSEQEWADQLARITLNQAGGGGGYLGTVAEADMESLDNATTPGVAIPQAVQDLLLSSGYSITSVAAEGTVTVLLANDAWLLTDRGRQFLIFRNDLGDFDFYFLGTGAFVVNQAAEFGDLPSGAGTANAVDVSAVVDGTDDDGNPFAQNLVGLFLSQGLVIPDDSQVAEEVSGSRWTLVANGAKYTLRLMGEEDSQQVYVISGGDGASFGSAANSTHIRIEAGFTLYSQYVSREVTEFQVDAIIDSSGRFLINGKMLFGNTGASAAALSVDVKLYFDVSQLTAGTGSVNFLSDFYVPSTTDPAEQMLVFSVHGFVTFGFFYDPAVAGDEPILIDSAYLSAHGFATIADLLDDDVNGVDTLGNNPDFFEITLSGSPTAGIAVFQASDLQTFTLGAPDPNAPATGPGSASLRFRNDRLEFEFDCGVSATGLLEANNFISAAGMFVLEFETGGGFAFKSVYGVAQLSITTDNIVPLSLAGIHGQADFILKINTDSDYQELALQLPGHPEAEAFPLPEYSFGLFAVATLTFSPPGAGSFINQQITGAFALEVSASRGFELFILGTMPVPLPVVGSFASPRADILGVLTISSLGIAGRLELAIRTSGAAMQMLDLRADLQMYFNTTSQPQVYRLPSNFADRFVDDLPASLLSRLDFSDDGSASITIPAAAPLLTFADDGATSPNVGPYLVLQGAGHLYLTPPGQSSHWLDITGAFRIAFATPTAGPNAPTAQFDFLIKGTVAIQPLGVVTALASLTIQQFGHIGEAGYSVDSAGQISLGVGLNLGILTFSGNAAIQFNTFDTPQPIDPSNPGAGTLAPNLVKVYIDGSLNLGGAFTISGTFSITNTPEKLSIVAAGNISLFGLSVAVGATAEIYKGAHAGLVLDVGVTLSEINIPGVFRLTSSGVYLRINTRDIDTDVQRPGAPAGTMDHLTAGLKQFDIGNISMTLLSSITITGSASITSLQNNPNGNWRLAGSLGFNLFNVFHVTASGEFYDTGAFKFDAGLYLQLGPDEFNINGTLNVHVSYLTGNAAPFNTLTAADLNITGDGSLGVHCNVDLGEIDLGLLGTIDLGSIDFDFTAVSASFGYTGSTGELWVRPCVNVGFDLCYTFSIGFIAFNPEPPVNLAGPAVASYTQDGYGYWNATWSSGQLFLNTGDATDNNRARLRNLSGTEINEIYTIEAMSALVNGRQTIKVKAFGKEQVFENVTGITGAFGNGNDTIIIDPNVRIPLTISGGEGNDKITYQGTAVVSIVGNGGNDRITAAGGAGSTIDGGEGDDVITWLAGNGANVTISGGGGANDQFIAAFTNGRDRVRLARPGMEQFRLSRLNDAGIETEFVNATSGFESLRINAQGGNDEVRISDFNTGGMQLYVDVSRYQTGTQTVPVNPSDPSAGTRTDPVYGNDTVADLVIVEGGSNTDTFTLTTPIDSADYDGDANTSERLLTVIRSGVYTLQILNSGFSSGDALNVNGASGGDTINASGVTAQVAALTLAGAAGNDTLVGSPFADTLDGGLGNDTFTGGLGTDTFADAGGRDTLIEARQADLLITDATFIVGTLTVASRSAFADQYASASEVESLLGIFEVARITGGSGANVLVAGDVDGKVRINGVLTQVGQQWSGTLDLIGGLSGDTYVVTVFGSAGAVINIVDSGGATDGTDSLRIFGSNNWSTGDTFLLRPNFVAALPAVRGDSGFKKFDRVTFTNAIEGGLTLNTLLGDDTVVIDDNSIRTTINTGGGRDFVQLGQIFGSERIAPRVAIGDEFSTTGIDLTPAGQTDAITGYVSNGASFDLTVNAGDDADSIVVFRNLVTVTLNGDAGNDTFTVRAFALASRGGGTAHVVGGGGADVIEYAINADVDINGGDGLDAVRVLGTQYGDTFVVTESGVSGSGLSVHFANVETLELHAGDGDDTVYVLGTPDGLRTSVFGGAGSDHFYITGQAPGETNRPLTLGRIAGPVLLEGGPGDAAIFAIPAALLIPGESDRRLPPSAGSMSGSELPSDRDTLDILDTDATGNDHGSHDAALWPDGGAGLPVHTLSGLGMGGALVQESETTPGGISYRRLEIVDVQLGSGGEFMSISSVAADCTTLFRGNGGADRFTITTAAANNARLVIFGDAAASSTHSGTSGNDLIDASASSLGATFYGGPGVDTILGGSGPDRIAGGSGADVLGGGGGDDVIFGDSGFDYDRVTNITTLRFSGTPGFDNFDVAAADVINPGAGSDIVFGDHGRLTQAGGAPGVLDTSSNWTTIETVNISTGGNDLISARSDANPAFGTPGAPALAGGDDLVFAGIGSDTVVTGGGNDTVFGDHGQITLSGGAFVLIVTTNPNVGGGDSLSTGPGNDRVIGGTGSDTIDAGADDDTIFGDHGRFDFSLPANSNFVSIFTGRLDGGAADTIMAGSGNDIALGQQGDDLLFGQEGDDDLIGGHNVAGGIDELDTLAGGNDRIDGGAGHDVIAGDNALIIRTGGGSGRYRMLTGAAIYLSDGTLLIDATPRPDPRGVLTRVVTLLDHDAAAPAGVYGADLIAGGFGDDMIFGQLGDDSLRGDGLLSAVSQSAGLLPSASPSIDGDDYIEGNGGNDGIWGDLGRDDLVGGSSSLFGLITAAQRLDGSDLIFGGTGALIARNDVGNTSAAGHAGDSDFIAGDNANIIRLVGASGAFLTFAYDNYTADPAARLVPRGIVQLDYTPGVGGAGAADEIRGEAGDDSIYGMTGNDTLYGDAQDDDVYGGVGNDWIYGGTGSDGLLGDDGIVSTARNATAEPLYGIAAAVQQTVNSGASVIVTTIFNTGLLQKYARLLAFTAGGDDVIYGGLGDDFVHAGAGLDAISGAEAMAAYYNIGATRPTLVYTPSLRRFTVFDPGTGMRKIANFFLNFDATLNGTRLDDGKDMLFGDHGHDWLVGGTNQDRMFGGMGDDVLNADDNLETNVGQNFAADSAPFNEADIAFGGGGLDRLIGNTTADRLIDWVDQFNQYLTPFVASSPTVVRTINVQLITSLLAIGRGAGADQLLLEPAGELGLVTQTDPEWADQLARPT